MKVFWSWQSDTPGKTGRFFVRDALQAAIAHLQQFDEIVEPAEREAVSAMHLDHDRKGASGSPDLARLILDKIESAAVFVADVTPIGIVEKAGGDGNGNGNGNVNISRPRKPINSNVAIELGYALHALTDRSLLMVMNDHYGSREDLPFDLRHKAGPFSFTLAPNADADTIAKASRNLTAHFVEALKLCVATKVADEQRNQPLQRTQLITGPATFFSNSDALATAGYPTEREMRFGADDVAYIRLIPMTNDPVGLARMNKTFELRNPCPMSLDVGGTPGRNKDGPIIYFHDGASTVTALTQGFPSGALWGVTGNVFVPYLQKNPIAQTEKIINTLPMITLEKLFVRVLKNYLKVEADLGLLPPFTLIVGITGLEGVSLTAPGGELGTGQFLGPIMEKSIQRSYTLVEATPAPSLHDEIPAEAAAKLRDFSMAIYDLAAASRADILTDAIIAAHRLPPR